MNRIALGEIRSRGPIYYLVFEPFEPTPKPQHNDEIVHARGRENIIERELRSLRHENSKLKQVVADLTLDRHILQEIVRKKL